jgi:hypothetical protein
LLQLARDLQSYPEATLIDRLQYLDFLHTFRDPEFSSYLTVVENATADKPTDLAVLASWMTSNNLSLLALDFVRGLPAEQLQKWPASIAVADIYTRLGDWRALENFVKMGSWQQFDFIRQAYLARALRAQDKPAAAEHEWADAVKEATARTDSLLLLLRTTSEWKWDSETADLLWKLTKYPEKQNEALQTLYRRYANNGDTQGLYRVLVRLSQLDPHNIGVQNNLAQVSLLLNATPEEARRQAADVYRRMSSNAAYAATYAYSLLTKGDAKEAVRIMSSLTEEQLRDPTISAYYGICLVAARDNRARAYLEAGRKATLLPEEKALIDKAFRDLPPVRAAP